jgi:hypothetical protein
VTEEELVLDAIHRLNRAGIVYFLTGSMASNYWGIPRTTHHLDFVVQLSGESIPNFAPIFISMNWLCERPLRHPINSMRSIGAPL